MARGLPSLVPIILLLVTSLAYWPGLGGGYVFDDFPNIVDNTALHVSTLDWHAWVAASMSSPVAELPRPIALLSFAINHYFTGLDPWPLKLTNLAIHLLNTVLVLGLARKLITLAVPAGNNDMRREWAARFTAAAWALHPINLMAVLFLVQRMESLSHTFVFGGLWLYLSGRERQLESRNGWPLIGAGLLLGTGLGTLTKESAVLLPLYAFLVEVCLLGFRNGAPRPDRRLKIAFAVLLVLPALAGVAWLLPKAMAPGAYGIRDFTLVERLLTEPRVVLDYLRWSLFPSLGELSLYHDDYRVSRGWWSPPSTSFALLAMLVLVALAWWLRTRRPLAALGVAWFLSAHLLTATFIPLELVYEHRNYFASLGICLALSDLLLLAPADPLRRMGVLTALIITTTFAATTHLRAREWSDPYRFAASEAVKQPNSPRAAYALGRIMTILSGYRPDSPMLQPARAAFERARDLPRSGVLPLSGLILLAANTGTPIREEWWLDMQQRLSLKPPGPQEINALHSLTRCAREGACAFPSNRMKALYQAALQHGPHPDVLATYGDYAANVQRDFTLALRLWREAVGLQPQTAQYRMNLIELLIATREYEQANIQIAELRSLGPLGQNVIAADQLQRQLALAAGNARRPPSQPAEGKFPP